MGAGNRRLDAGTPAVTRSSVGSYTRDGARFLTLRYGPGPLDPGLLDEVDAAIEHADLESSVACIVLRRVDSPGASSPPPANLPGDVIARRQRLDASIAAARRVPKLLVFLLEGTLAGEGIGLLALADIVLATNESVLRPGGVPAALLGMVPVLQQRSGGVRSALLCLLEGRDLDALAARHHGLVTDVVPAERLEPVLDSLLRGIASAGPTATAMLKASAK
jgi:enoyl-CoA hydratase/carnithine racemase